MKEEELYPSVKRFLEGQGYQVKGEVKDCDVVAVRDDETPVIVELKTSLTLAVVLQAVERLSLTEKVYVGIPRKKSFRKNRHKVIKLLRMLGLGLLLVDPNLKTGAVDVVIDPGGYTPRRSKPRRERLLREFVRRSGDPNLGGMAKRKGVMTAYRQRALAVGRYLETEGPTKAALVAKALAEPKAREIMYRDVYGWFDRVSTGVYALSPRGKKEIVLWGGVSEDEG